MKAWQRNLLRKRKRGFEEDLRRRELAKSSMATSPNLGSFKVLCQSDQDMLLLRHLALLFGERTFDPYKAPEEITGFVSTKGLAYSSAELQEAHLYLLTNPWSAIVSEGFVSEAPTGSGMYEITAKGWVMVESNTFEVDSYYIDRIFS
jgi:hypothetical protein